MGASEPQQYPSSFGIAVCTASNLSRVFETLSCILPLSIVSCLVEWSIESSSVLLSAASFRDINLELVSADHDSARMDPPVECIEMDLKSLEMAIKSLFKGGYLLLLSDPCKFASDLFGDIRLWVEEGSFVGG